MSSQRGGANEVGSDCFGGRGVRAGMEGELQYNNIKAKTTYSYQYHMFRPRCSGFSWASQGFGRDRERGRGRERQRQR